MKRRDIFDAIGQIDDELLESSEQEVKRGKIWMKWSAGAACLCITAVLAWGIGMPYIRTVPEETKTPNETIQSTGEDVPSEPSSVIETPKTPESREPSVVETQKTPESREPTGTNAPESEIDKNSLLSVPLVSVGNQFSERTELNVGKVSSSGGATEIIPPGFYIATVAELEVIEVLPDKYSFPGARTTCHIVKMKVKDAVIGEGLPDVVYLKYYY